MPCERPSVCAHWRYTCKTQAQVIRSFLHTDSLLQYVCQRHLPLLEHTQQQAAQVACDGGLFPGEVLFLIIHIAKLSPSFHLTGLFLQSCSFPTPNAARCLSFYTQPVQKVPPYIRPAERCQGHLKAPSLHKTCTWLALEPSCVCCL